MRKDKYLQLGVIVYNDLYYWIKQEADKREWSMGHFVKWVLLSYKSTIMEDDLGEKPSAPSGQP